MSNNAAQVFAGSLNFNDLTHLIKRADLMISVDTGPAHIAEAVNTPLVVLFGPTNSILWGPRSSHSKIIRSEKTCSSCKKACDRQHKCMTSIKTSEVIRAAEHILTSIRN